MTNFTANTITINISSAGPTPPTIFDAATSIWDTANWDDKTLDLVTNVQKLITESEPSTSAIQNNPFKLLQESEGSTSTIVNNPLKILSETEILSAGASAEYKFDGGIWNYDFPDFTSNFESMSTATFTAATNNSVNWSTVVNNTVGWS